MESVKPAPLLVKQCCLCALWLSLTSRQVIGIDTTWHVSMLVTLLEVNNSVKISLDAW